MDSECIFNQIVNNQDEDQEDNNQNNQKKRYKSIHPGNLPPSYSTFNTQNTTLQINNINGNQTLHKGYLKHFALWGKPKKFEVTDELIFPIGIVKPQKCDFRQPKIWKHYQYKAEKDKLNEYLQNKPKRPKTADHKQIQINYLKKKEFGQIPDYLQKMKNDKLNKQREEEEEIRNKKKELQDKKIKKEDIYKIMQQLLNKKQQLLIEFAQYSHKRDMTEQTKQKKETLEQQLNNLDKDIKKLERLYNK